MPRNHFDPPSLRAARQKTNILNVAGGEVISKEFKLWCLGWRNVLYRASQLVREETEEVNAAFLDVWFRASPGF